MMFRIVGTLSLSLLMLNCKVADSKIEVQESGSEAGLTHLEVRAAPLVGPPCEIALQKLRSAGCSTTLGSLEFLEARSKISCRAILAAEDAKTAVSNRICEGR